MVRSRCDLCDEIFYSPAQSASAVENIYADADTDRDGYLIWLEIKAFQRILRNCFKYLTNSLAIRPDEFMNRGGGEGHAICVVCWQEKRGHIDFLSISSV